MAKKSNNNIEQKKVVLQLWGYCPSIGTAWVDSLEEVDDDLAECARDECGWWGLLDISEIEGELLINGVDACLDLKSVRLVKAGVENTWSNFYDKIGIYSVDIDKAGCSAEFTVDGDFDPEKLVLYYKTAIGPGYYEHPENCTIDLLDRVEYDGVKLELDYDGEWNNKGCMFTVFNKGQYAEYGHGCDIDDLTWTPFPIDFRRWKDWSDELWKQYETMLAKHNAAIKEQFEKQLTFACVFCDLNQCDFLAHACTRSLDWATLSWNWGEILQQEPSLLDNKSIVKMVREWCDACDESDDYYEDDDDCDNGEGGTLNRWAYILSYHPQLADYCSTYQKFNGFSRCMLIANRPQFAETFSMEELGDPKGKCWATCDDDDYSAAWEMIVSACPELARFRKG